MTTTTTTTKQAMAHAATRQSSNRFEDESVSSKAQTTYPLVTRRDTQHMGRSLTARCAAVPFLVMGFATFLSTACGDNAKPSLDSVQDQTATVGVEMNLLIQGRDPDGDALVFSLSVPSIHDIDQRTHPPRFESFGPNAAYLMWTPLAADVGMHQFQVTASDGQAKTTISFTVTVQSGNAVPVFREPIGSGTTLDLSHQQCLDVDVVVEDADSPEVDISLQDPIEEGYDFTQDDPLAGTFSWCPNSDQINAASRYTLNITANDRDDHITTKKYVIVIRKDLGTNCPGEAPQVTDSPPADAETLDDIVIQAHVTDDKGLANDPVLYYSAEQPADPAHPDFSKFVQVIMSRTSGDSTNGQYEGIIPNPVLSDPTGTTKTIYYFVEATDNDDDKGDCDHRTTSPDGDVYHIAITRPAGSTPFKLCRNCWYDVQCGDTGLCIVMGGGDGFCLPRCGNGQNCPTDTTCTESALESIGNVSDKICTPNSGSCEETCTDDSYEENDDMSQAKEITPGEIDNLHLCGSGATGLDEDYYTFTLSQQTLSTVTLVFSDADGDIDLDLLDHQGNSVAESSSTTDNEEVKICLPPDQYYIDAMSYTTYVNAPYNLILDLKPGGCCIDDDNEDDDQPAQAHTVTSGGSFDNMSICDDDDWFAIALQPGDKVVVDLLFDQADEQGDLDLHFYDRDGWTDLTPCPPCSLDNGQSATSDEHLEYTVDQAGTYFVVVRGFQDAQNTYMIGFEVQHGT